MKVVFVINDLNYFAIHRQELAVAWLDRGWQVTVLSGGPSGRHPQLDSRLDVRLMHLVKHRLAPVRDVLCAIHIRNALDDVGPDVVHAFTIKAVLLAGLAVMSCRGRPGLVLTFPGLGKIFEPSKSIWSNLRRTVTVSILHWVDKGCSPWATFENEQDCNRAIEAKFARQSRSTVVQGAGIDLARFYPPVQPRSGQLKFVMASRLLTTKGVDTFLDVARRLQGKVSFTLTGMRDEEDADAIDESQVISAARDGVIEWRGATPVDEMGDLFREHDVAVLPTRLKEGFPRSLLEAGACGCALIASDQQVIAQIVRPGRTGWLLPEPTVNSLAAAVQDATLDPQRTRAMGRDAAALVSSMKVDTPSIVAEMADIYTQVSTRTTSHGPRP